LEDISCLFCAEEESVHHLFFDCCGATLMWKHLSDILNIQIGIDFEYVARWWLSNKRNSILNMCSAALLWCIWKLRNHMCFQGRSWKDERVLLNKLSRTLESWLLLCKEESVEKTKLGDQITEDKKPTTSTADHKLAGEGIFYTVNVGSAVIRVGSIPSGLQSHVRWWRGS